MHKTEFQNVDWADMAGESNSCVFSLSTLIQKQEIKRSNSLWFKNKIIEGLNGLKQLKSTVIH